MARQTVAAALGDMRQLGAASGIALSTTVARTFIPRGARWISLTPRNFSTAVVAQVAFNPWLTILKTTDDLAARANQTDYSDNAQDDDVSTSVDLSDLDTDANDDALYVGAEYPFAGVNVDVDGANANASVLSVDYWQGSAWTDITPTDGTDSGGATFAVDGDVTWAVPSDWIRASLYEVQLALDGVHGTAAQNFGLFTRPLFWTKWTVSAALDAAVTADAMLAIRTASGYFELIENQAFEQSIQSGPGGFVSFDALVDAGTGNLVATAAGRFLP